jgi:hypothetical protein
MVCSYSDYILHLGGISDLLRRLLPSRDVGDDTVMKTRVMMMTKMLLKSDAALLPMMVWMLPQ